MDRRLGGRIIKKSFKEIQELKSKYDDNVTVIVNKCSLVKVCPYCNRLYIPTHHRQKFCTRKCFKEHRRDYKAKWKREKYQLKPYEKVGTGYLQAKPKKDFDKEHIAVKKELKRMGIYKKR